jgi:3-hydroxyacyl-[acyl-carrier-protein] dehydratase
MADAVHHTPGTNGSKPSVPASARPFTAGDEAALGEALKRCSPATLAAAAQFRKTGDPALVPAVVIGVIERFLEPDQRTRLRAADDDIRLIEDLGVDSLTMMEIVMLVEESLQMSINNEELRHLRTLGDIKVFIDCKVRGLPPPKPSRFLPIEQIGAVMPVQPPFLLLNEATVGGGGATGKYKITGDEFFLKGHFKDNPVLPASIMLEALGQLAVLFLLEGGHGEEGMEADPAAIYFTGCEGVRAHRVCKPGDTLVLSIKPKRLKMPLATFEGQIRVGQEKAAFAEEITLTYALRAVAAAPESSAAPAASPEPAGVSRADAPVPTHPGRAA